MARFSYAEINCIGLILLALILVHQRHAAPSRRQAAFNRLALSLALILLLDTCQWLADGQAFAGAHALLLWSTIGYYVLNVLIPFLWLLYILAFFQREPNRQPVVQLLYAVPMAVNLILIFANAFVPLIFSIDQNNVYARGDWFFLPVATSAIYLASGIAVALHCYCTTRVSSQKKESLQMIRILMLPILGMVIQLLFYGASTIWICCALAMLITFINFQNRQIAIDPLTGLNNRYQFDRYIASLSGRSEREVVYVLTMIDVDDFKKINDRYGHLLGDEALIALSNILKDACQETRAFLSRYGGDEFLLVSQLSAHDSILAAVDEGLRALNESARFPFPLGLSRGSASFTPADCAEISRIISQADQCMYLEKTAKTL